MRFVFRPFTVALCLACCALFLLVVTAPGTWSGVGYASAFVLLSVARLVAERRRAALVTAAGVLVLVGTATTRCFAADAGTTLVMKTNDAEGARMLARIVDEKDLAVNAARMMRLTHAYRDPDVATLPEVMEAAYARMRAREGDAPSPVLATYLGLETPGGHDVIEIGDVEHANGVILFLHGFAGSFILPCWELSQAAARAKLATVCPSTGPQGDWWSSAGEQIVRATVESLHARGVSRIYLAGLSNGGVGATLLAPRMRGAFKGILLISGASAAAAPPGIPVLAIQGRRDAMMPASMVRAYTTRASGRYVEFDAGHFVMLLRAKETQDAVASWLAR